MLDWPANPEGWIALGTLTALEIVLGIDNIIFISVLVARLPEAQRTTARVMTCRVARSFPNQTAYSSEKGGRPVSDFSFPSVQSAITVLLIDAHKDDRQ